MHICMRWAEPGRRMRRTQSRIRMRTRTRTRTMRTLRTHCAGVLGEYEFISFNLRQQQQQKQLLPPDLDLVKIKEKLRTHDIFQQCKGTLQAKVDILFEIIIIKSKVRNS